MRGRRWFPCHRGRPVAVHCRLWRRGRDAGVGMRHGGAPRQGHAMTDHKHLKRLVRDRMAQTGESYTTAWRRLLTVAAREQAPALPPGLVPTYDLFGGGQHRLSALATHL